MGKSGATTGNERQTGPLGWGFLGCGRIAHDFVQAISPLTPQHAQFRACAARSLDRAKDFAQEFGE